MIQVKLNDLSRMHERLHDDIDAAMERVLKSGWFLRGRETEAFEQEWAEFCGQDYCVSCASGTDALTIAASALEMRTASIQANTLPLTAIGLHRAGVDITIAEIDSDGRMAADADNAVPVLLFGRYPTPKEERARLFDAAHAHGWRPPRGAVACWSFYPTKTLGALGDAGAVTTNDPGLAALMRDLTGRDDVLRDARQMTSRMDELQAAILRTKLPHLPGWIAERRAAAAWYAANLPQTVRIVSRDPRDFQHLFVIRARDRDRLMNHLGRLGIETKIHFPTPLYRQAAPWGKPGHPMPRADDWCASVLSLPCFPEIEERELRYVATAVEQFDPA